MGKIYNKSMEDFLELINSIVVSLDTKGNIVSINKKGLEMLGYKKSEILGKNWFDTCLPKNSLKQVKQIFEKVVEEEFKQSEYFENPIITKKGEEKLISWHNTIIKDENGKIIGTLSYGEDITKKKKQEEKLKESEEKLKTLLDINPDPLIIADIKGHITYLNESVLKATGYKKEEIINKNVITLPFISKKSKLKISKEIALHLATGKSEKKYLIEIITKKKEKEIFELNSANIKENNKTIAWIVSLRNITPIKKEKDRLDKERKQFLSMFDGMEEAVYVADPKTYELLYMNPSAKKGWGGKIGDKCYKVLQNKNSPCSFCTNSKIFGKNLGKTHVWESQNLVNKKWYKYINRAIKWPDGRDVRFELAIDITNQKAVQKQLKESEEKFRQMAEKIQDVFWITDWKTKKTIYASPSYEKIWGRSLKDLYKGGFNWIDAISEDCRKKAKETFIKLSEGETYDQEYKIIMPDNSIKWIRDRGYPIKDKKGKIYRIVGIAQDITNQKSAEQKLKESQEKYKNLFESSQDAIMILAPHSWKFTSGNPATIKMFRAKDEKEFITKSPMDVSPKYQPDNKLSSVKAKAMIEKAMKQGSNFFEWTHKRLNGEVFPATVLLTKVEIKGQELLQATVRDIINQKKSETALKERTEESEKFNQLAVGRELKMVELKKEINKLLSALNKPPKYEVQ